MSKAAGIGIFLSLAACAGVGFGVVEVKRLSTSLSAMEKKLAAVEAATTVPSAAQPAADGSSPAVEERPVTMAQLSDELVKLKAELADVRTVQEQAVASKPAANPAGGEVAHVSGDEVREAVNEVLAERDKKRQEEEAKRDQERQARMVSGIVDGLVKELGLTEQQKQQITEIMPAQMQAFRDVWTNRKEGEDMGAKMAEVRKDTDTKIKAVLTTEQQVKYDEIARNPAQMFGFGGRGGGGFQGGGGNRGQGGGDR